MCRTLGIPGFYAIDTEGGQHNEGDGDMPGAPLIWGGVEGVADLKVIVNNYDVGKSDLQILMEHEGQQALTWSPFRVINALPFALRRSKALNITHMSNHVSSGQFSKSFEKTRYPQLAASFCVTQLNYLIQYGTTEAPWGSLTVCRRPAFRAPPARRLRARPNKGGSGVMITRGEEVEIEDRMWSCNAGLLVVGNALAEGVNPYVPPVDYAPRELLTGMLDFRVQLRRSCYS
jgi:hypothetical protein